MTLGKCPDCQKLISYRAKSCPHCGSPFEYYGSLKGYLDAAEEERKERVRRRRRKSFRRFIIFVMLLLILGGTLFLCYISGRISPSTMSAGNGSGIIVMPSSAPTASAAETTIQQYYDDVNSQNYQSAYIMWDSQKESLADFQKGYSHTKSDTLLFGDVVSQADGTTKVYVTVVATEITSSGGTIQHTYKGYYIVGPRGNEWKILYGILSRI